MSYRILDLPPLKMEDEVNLPLPPFVLDAYDIVNEYIREQRALRDEHEFDLQYHLNIEEAIARFIDIVNIRIDSGDYENLDNNPDQQSSPPPPPDPNNHPMPPPPPPLRFFSREEVDQFMQSLHQIDISSLAAKHDDDKLCEICFQCYDEWRWSDDEQNPPANAGALKPFNVLEDMMPENAVRLPCGHVFGELCLRTWIMEMRSEGTPTCPKCRAVLKKVGRGVNSTDT